MELYASSSESVKLVKIIQQGGFYFAKFFHTIITFYLCSWSSSLVGIGEGKFLAVGWFRWTQYQKGHVTLFVILVAMLTT